MDIISDSALGGEEEWRSITSQHLLLLESLMVNHIYLSAFAKESSIWDSAIEDIWAISNEYMSLDCLIPKGISLVELLTWGFSLA